MNESKLKTIKWGLIFSLIALASILVISVFALYDALFDESTKLDAYGYTWLAFAGFNLVLWIIRKDWVSLSFILINLTMAVSYLSDYKGVFIAVPLLVLYSFYAYVIYVNHKFSTRYRRLLELAAKSVEGTTDGYTPRPYPAGKLNIEPSRLFEFASFLKKHCIAFPYIEKGGILFAIKDHRRFWFGHPRVPKDSYVFFNFSGETAVTIAKKDYQKYNKEYSFDELCDSLSRLFKQMYTYFDNGQEHLILNLFADTISYNTRRGQ